MRVKLVDFVARGVVLRRRGFGRKRFSLVWGELLSAERMPSGRGFQLHVLSGDVLTMVVGKRRRRAVERSLRDAHVQVVDEYGARIDESQFRKEEDPEFVRRCVAEYARGVGLWSDDA